ncbi:MAG: YlbF family regulator [Clostridiales bacterium]|nr:YlbF family regulator [Clostridiales bacterium]
MNEELQSLVEQLKEVISNHPVIVEYLAAKQAYIDDKSLISKANEYNVQRQVLETESRKEDKDDLLIESVKARLEVLYNDISNSPAAHRLIEAEDDANEFYNEIIKDLQSVVIPESDSSCGGDCDCCSGCH